MVNRRYWIYSMAWLMGAIAFAPAHAAADALIEGAKLCTRHLPRYEREYGIPTHLLSAIASTESGRYHQGLKLNIPWPWTINTGGKGYYYDSKAEAVAAAKKFRARGMKSMDVGCMQVNLQHHPDAFASLEQAFEPQYNVAYAAGFLRALYQSENSWKKAAAGYHSKTPSRGSEYVGRVYGSWYKIIDKLRAAKMQVASAGSPAAAKPIQLASAPQPKTIRPIAEQAARKAAGHQPPRMNSIKVSRKNGVREHGVLVIRPAVRVVDEPAPSAAARPAVITQTALANVSDVRLESPGKKPGGPNFIFAD